MLDFVLAFYSANLLIFLGVLAIPILLFAERGRLAQVDRGFNLVLVGVTVLTFATFIDYAVSVIENFEITAIMASPIWPYQRTILALTLYLPGAVTIGVGLSSWMPALQRLDQEVDRRRFEQQLYDAQRIGMIGHWNLDLNSGAFDCSREVYRIFGVDPDTPVQWQDLIDIVHEDDRMLAEHSRTPDIMQGFAEGRHIDFAYRINQRPDGGLRYIEGRTTPIFDDNGKLTGLFGVTQDVSDRRRLEEEIAAKEAAEQANLAKTEFLANMSHELRTPLNAIIGFSETMNSQIFGPLGDRRYVNYMHDIHQSGLHLLNLINDILDLSKVDAGKIDIHESNIDILGLARNTISMFRLTAREKSINLIVQNSDPGPTLRGDERMIKQMLANLVGNALKFTPEGGEIKVDATIADDGSLKLSVSDTGIGIPSAALPKALERFGQVDSGLNRQFEGTGLGLTLVMSFAELHGGGLVIDSEVNAGTTATVWFPPERCQRPNLQLSKLANIGD